MRYITSRHNSSPAAITCTLFEQLITPRRAAVIDINFKAGLILFGPLLFPSPGPQADLASCHLNIHGSVAMVTG